MLAEFDRRFTLEGQLIAGMDEAGRGPLAGPVVAACVALPLDELIDGVYDSKKVSEARREKLHDLICEKAITYGIGIATVEEIEQLNILGATHLAMHRAVSQLTPAPQQILCDYTAKLDIPTLQVVGGDAKSYMIGAASILAKVERDRIMRRMDEEYPGYGFGGHKGYGTAAHCKAIRELGPSPVHRASFLTKILGGSHE